MAYKPQVDDPDPLADIIKKALGGVGGTATEPVVPPAGNPSVPGNKSQDGMPGLTDEEDQHTEPVGPRVEADPSPVSTPSPVTAPTSPILDFGRLHGYDKGKFDANKDDAKYKMAHVFAGFDPRQGITPEILAALNALGYGKFSGQGDKLSFAGATDAGRKAGLSGDYNDADFIEAFNGGDGHWSYSDPASEAAHPDENGGGNDSSGGTNGGTIINMDNGVPTDSDFFNKLMDAARQAAGGHTDRKSLLSIMGL